MPIDASDLNRRQYERHDTNMVGLLLVENRPSMFCRVRDISMGGVRIETEVEFLLPSRVKLLIGDESFESTCIVRHQTQRSVGLEFVENKDREVIERIVLKSKTVPASGDDASKPVPVPAPALARAEPKAPVVKPVASRQLRQSLFAREQTPPPAAEAVAAKTVPGEIKA